MATKSLAPLIVILGPTGSGKTDLAIELADKFDGEIVCADSRTVYRGLDIGTAKPTVTDLRRVPHHLLNVVTPDESFNVAQFKALADEAIEEIIKKGKVPFLVGGSGLYIDAVIYNFGFRLPADLSERRTLEKLSVEELQDSLRQQDLALPSNERNPRHLIRALETKGSLGQRDKLRNNTLILGLDVSVDKLTERSKARAEHMLADGLIEEGERLFRDYDSNLPAFQAPAYQALKAYLHGEVTYAELAELIVAYDRRLAKKQRTWFKRNKSTHWVGDPREAVDIVTTFLNKHP